MSTTHATSPRRPMPTWQTATIASVFGLFYAYAVWNAVGLLIDQAGGQLGLNALGWGLLLFTAAFPALVFAGAFVIGARRRAGEFAVILLVGLALVAVFWLNVVAYALSSGGSLLGG